jgi:hypothetical protein
MAVIRFSVHAGQKRAICSASRLPVHEATRGELPIRSRHSLEFPRVGAGRAIGGAQWRPTSITSSTQGLHSLVFAQLTLEPFAESVNHSLGQCLSGALRPALVLADRHLDVSCEGALRGAAPRGLLRWSAEDLAREAALGLATIKRARPLLPF